MDSTTQESQCLPASPPLKRSLFSHATAQANGKAGAQARIANANARKLEFQQAQARLELLQPIVNGAIAQAATHPVGSDEEYRLFRLARTREQLADLDREWKLALEPKERKSLADAIGRLQDVEQRLANRPLPGSRRPGREKPTDGAGTSPID